MQRNTVIGAYGPLEDLREALDASGVVGVWYCDCVRRTARYDVGAAELLAGDPGLAGRSLDLDAATAAIHPEDVRWALSEHDRMIKAGGPMLSEYRVVSPVRGTRWLLSRGRVYRDPEGRSISCRGILIDVTESRQDARDDGRGYGARPALRQEDPWTGALDRCLEARRLIEADGAGTQLRLLLDLALYEISRHLAQRSAH